MTLGEISEPLGPSLCLRGGLGPDHLGPGFSLGTYFPTPAFHVAGGERCRLQTALLESLAGLEVWRDRPLCGRALPLFKVVRTCLGILCLQHEPGVFQDGLAHLQQSHTAEETRSLERLPCVLPRRVLGTEALGNRVSLSKKEEGDTQ